MSLARLFRVTWLDLRHNATRPLFWICLLILALVSWGLSSGDMRISSGDSTVGGTKAWLTSEFAMSQMLSFVVLLFYGFFVSVAAGMAVIQDEVNSRFAEQINRAMYLLSIVACVFLPLTLLTGLLGINVAGIPWANAKWAFGGVCVMLVGLSLFELWLFKKLKWI